MKCLDNKHLFLLSDWAGYIIDSSFRTDSNSLRRTHPTEALVATFVDKHWKKSESILSNTLQVDN
jgi:hypothetical protein